MKCWRIVSDPRTGYRLPRRGRVKEHPKHTLARDQLRELVRTGDTFALAPQVVLEFIHVVTDPKRFANPLSVGEARTLGQQWWTAVEVKQVFPDEATVSKFLEWHGQFQLGRKRLLDTLLAATYWRACALSVLTTDPNDFAIFGVFSCVSPTIVPKQ